jgi:hypothetical protein
MRRLSLVILAMFLLSVSAVVAQSATATEPTQPTQQQETEPATNGAAADPYQAESADQAPPAAPAEDPAQTTDPNALPETASDLPLLAGLGLLALAGVIIVRSGLKKSS